MIDLGIILIILSPYLAFIPSIVVLWMICLKKVPIYFNPLNVGLGLLFIWALISGIVNGSLISVLASLAILFYFCLVIYLEYILVDENIITIFFKKVWNYSLIAAVIGILEKIASYFFDLTWIADFYFNEPIEYVYRIYSTLGNPNVAGSWFAVMIIVGLYFTEIYYNRVKINYIIGLLIFITALVFSGSKGAILALEAAVLIYAFLTKNTFSRKMILSIFCAVVVLAFISPEINHELHSRLPIWVNALNLYIEKPIMGWGTFGFLEQTEKLHAHNLWISLLTMYGTVGFIIYLWVKVYIWKSMWLLYKHNLQIFPALAAIHVLIIVHGCVDFVMMTPQGGILFFASAAMITGLVRNYEDKFLSLSKFKRLA